MAGKAQVRKANLRLVGLFVSMAVLTLLAVGCRRSSPEAALPQRSEPLNVVLIVVDTLAAKHVGAYAPQWNNSPHIDNWAQRGVRFTAARSVSSWTKPAVASLFTAKFPARHGVMAMRDKLAEAEYTLAEALQTQDYRNAGFVSHTILAPRSGYGQGFAKYEQLNRHRNVHAAVTSEVISTAALDWLQEGIAAAADQPFFLFLHYFDPHFRYIDHAEFNLTAGYQGPLRPGMSFEALMRRKGDFSAADLDYLKKLHQSEVAYTDKHIGRILDYLTETGLAENTLVIITADHGEEFMEHKSLGHTNTLYEEIINVPLIVVGPGVVAARVEEAPVSLVDIMPTVLDLCGGRPVPGVDGISLAPALMGQGILDIQRDIFAEVAYRRVAEPDLVDPHLLALVSGPWKLINNRRRNQWLLFDLAADPGEKRNLARQRPDKLAELKEKLEPFSRPHDAALAAGGNDGEVEELSPEKIDSLKSLGYL